MTVEARDIWWTMDVLGKEHIDVHAAGNTDVGRVREHNEDSWLVSPPVFLVADGMGGHAFGDVASAMVVKAFEPLAGRPLTRADVEGALDQCVLDVNSLADEVGGAPGTTLTLLARVADGGGQWLVANIGDSRTYLLTDGALERLTHDHSVVQELVDAGDLDESAARTHPDRNVITRSIGAHQSLPADVTFPAIPVGSRVLLCSDGVCGEIDDDAIQRILTEAAAPTDAVEQLIAAANAAGGHDNATAIVLDLEPARADANEDTLGRPLTELLEDTIPGGRRG